jgi:signal transduction histidine kinase
VLRIVAHDLRNPLNTVQLAAGLLIEQTPAEAGLERKQLDLITRSVDRANRLIQDLLDAARVGAGRFTVDVAPVSAASLVHEAIELGRLAAESKGVQLGLDAPDDLPPILADRDRMLQVFSNLIANAIEATPAGGRIRVSARYLEGEVHFAVTDTGAGIREDQLRHLFDPFWQARKGKKGTGLGLAIVRGIIEAHGGRVTVESQPGAGTTFRFGVRVAN